MIYINLHTSRAKVRGKGKNDKSSKYLHDLTEIHHLMWIWKINVN